MSTATTTTLSDDIVRAVTTGESVSVLHKAPAPLAENELVFFFKPEAFLPGVDSQRLITYALSVLDRFSVTISAVFTMSGPELDRLRIMDTHYGFINVMSRSASRELEANELAKLRDAVGATAETPVIGGHEVLQKFPDFTATSLDRLWASKRSIKVRSGLYVQQFELPVGPVVIVNGFHPAQLAHFTGFDRSIALLLLHSDLPWRFLRTRMLGDTFPENALPETIRRHYYDRAVEYGLPPVSIANNCVHMSAGPFEALFELRNFFGRVQGHEDAAERSRLAGRLHAARVDLQAVLSNPVAQLNGKQVPLFDATEEVDTSGAISVFRQVYEF